jgi:calcineurin-like phosphoesterase family protein
MKIVLEKDQRLFFTSDTHYNHANICSATTNWENESGRNVRDFSSLAIMNANLIDNINGLVREQDILIHLGDWSFGGFESIAAFRNQIACKTIHLVLGNHDHHIKNNKEGIKDLFASVSEYRYLTVVEQAKSKQAPATKHRFILSHYPIASWQDMGQGVMHLHGHVHLPNHLRVGPGKMMDVGVDGNGLVPINLEEVLSILEPRPIKGLLNFDHHLLEN